MALFENNCGSFQGKSLNGEVLFHQFLDSQGNLFQIYGKLQNGKLEGKGKLFNRKNLIYEGDFKNNLYHGKGKLNNYCYNSILKSKYEGDFENGFYHGEGKFQLYQDGLKLISTYEGKFKNNQKHGQGQFIFEGYTPKKIAKVVYKHGQLDGILKDVYEQIEYLDGQFDNNESLNGTIKFSSGLLLNCRGSTITGTHLYGQQKYVGEYNSLGQSHGRGIMLNGETKLFEGEFINDKFYSQIKPCDTDEKQKESQLNMGQ